MLQIVRQLTWRHALFSVKTFVAAMLALYIAFRLNLSRPVWSVTTVYVISQPFAGMVLAKSFYRILGTIIGAIASLVFVALFSNSPELFCLALALWIGAGTLVSIYLRDAPQAYAGMLAGYSAAIIGLPAALAPTTAFDFAVERCLEIMIGIGCGTLMHHLVLPQRAGDALRKTLHAALPDMARWVNDSLSGEAGSEKALADRRTIIATMMSLDAMRAFAVLDAPALRPIDTVLRQFEGKMLSLLALLVALYDRVALLRRQQPEAADRLRPILQRVATHIAGSAGAATPEQSDKEAASEAALVAEIEAELPSHQVLQGNPEAFLVRSILLRLIDILRMWRDAVWIRAHISTERMLPDHQAVPTFRSYRDFGFAVLGGFVSTAAVLLASAFWIATAWPAGPTAVTFAGIICAIAGARDNPAAIAAVFLKMSVVGAAVAGIYLFIILPPLTTFGALVVALAPLYLVCGLLLTVPAGAPYVLPVIFNGGGLIAISNEMQYDFAVFLNNALAYVVGIWIGALALALLRPLSMSWAVERLTRGMMADLAHTADVTMAEGRSTFESRMFDRINALLMRLDQTVAEQNAIQQGAFASLRIGLNMLALRSFRPSLSAPALQAIDAGLVALRAHFVGAARSARATSPLPVLQAARARIMSLGNDAPLTRAAESLYSIEVTLAQHAAFFGLPDAARRAPSTEAVPA
ncbi:FUSC family protein [Bradyrhizobium erythrophlei]|uniref:FUSC family protein n=1 Tax=Bradyrhizobium erythrophlei TaxID=1437360 RepID=UPI0035EE30CA